mmetsp:Transcript_40834/g.130358  ORF Transcript_40834/g.130358 Transcript_40834/m.130358 type:complete len:251 (-) Transcript_40834:1026-1778(-)
MGVKLHVDHLPKKKKALPGCERTLDTFAPAPPPLYDKALVLRPGTVFPSRGSFAPRSSSRKFRSLPSGEDSVDNSLRFAQPTQWLPSAMNSYLRTRAPVPNPVHPTDALTATFDTTRSKYPPSSTAYPAEFPPAGKGKWEARRPPGTWSSTTWHRPSTAPAPEAGAGDAPSSRPATAYAPPVGYFPGNNTASRAHVPNGIKPPTPTYRTTLHSTRSRYPMAPTNYPPQFPRAGFFLGESYQVPKLPAWER